MPENTTPPPSPNLDSRAPNGTEPRATLPVFAREARRLGRDRRARAQTVLELVASDPILTARVLRSANAVRPDLPVGSLASALVVLGLRSIQTQLQEVDSLDLRGDSGSQSQLSQMWAHSFAVAVAAEEIARATGRISPGEAYAAGLLHELGPIILATGGSGSGAAQEPPADPGSAAATNEGPAPGEVAARAIRSWQLPEAILSVASQEWEDPTPSEAARAIRDVVALADVVVTALGLGGHGSEMAAVTTGLSQRLGYDEETLMEWISRVHGRISSTRDRLSLTGCSLEVFDSV